MMTIAERQLVALGEHARVRGQRLFLQLALEDKKRSEVERILKRRALACVRCESPPAGLAYGDCLLDGSQRRALEVTSGPGRRQRRQKPTATSGRPARSECRSVARGSGLVLRLCGEGVAGDRVVVDPLEIVVAPHARPLGGFHR
jgi:hypothetical protein